MKFTKMHGCGNDYVYVNCFEETVEGGPALARLGSDRHFGVGGDGLICICPSDRADFRMDMYNADGSAGEMCGNGIRCVAKYVYEHGMTDKTVIDVETGAGIKTLYLNVEDGEVKTVRVCMGSPEFALEKIPVTADDVDWLDLPAIGPLFENDPRFPERINTEFVEVIDEHTLKMRVWERGSGETLACGTGSTASLAAAVVNGKCADSATLRLRGGELLIEWDRESNLIYMTGPAVTVFDGELKL